MATVKGVNRTLLTNVPQEFAGVGEAGGRVRLLYDKYTWLADPGDGDIIEMGAPIPKGARVIDAMVKFADMGSSGSGTFEFGWAVSADGTEVADANGFIDAFDADAAADVVKASDQQASPPGVGKKFVAEVQPIITTTGVNVTSGDVESFILYVLD
jgi:hypothetical protein